MGQAQSATSSCALWVPMESDTKHCDTGLFPCADVGQQDFGWSVRPSAMLKARAGEGMGRPWGSLRGPKVIRRWLHPNWTENWCTRPPCCMLQAQQACWELANGSRVGQAQSATSSCALWVPMESDTKHCETGPFPCADVGQQDFGWSVRPSAMLIARAGEGMGRPWGSLRGPKEYAVGFTQTGQKIGALALPAACYRLSKHVGGPPAGVGWDWPSLQPEVARCGCRWRATPNIATVWPAKSCVAGDPSAT